MVFCDTPGTDMAAFEQAMSEPDEYLESLKARNVIKSFELIKIMGMPNGFARVIVGSDANPSTLEFVGTSPDTILKAAALGLFAIFH